MQDNNLSRRWFGYFGSKTEPTDGFPAVDEFVDPRWNPPDKVRLLAYIAHAPIIKCMTSGPSISCVVCSRDLGDGSEHHSDGVWVWPASLAHYVREHAVTLPPAFVEHIRSRAYSLPPQDTIDWAALDWPKPSSES